MRSGPATRTAPFLRVPVALSTHEAWGRAAFFTCTPKSPGSDATRQIDITKRTSRTNLRHYGGSDGKSNHRWRTLEEAATPGQPVRALALIWRNPPDNSPSRIIRNRWLCRNALAGRAGFSLECCHCALSQLELQEQTKAVLCRSCECQKFLVESNGKLVHSKHALIYAQRTKKISWGKSCWRFNIGE